MRKIPTLFRRDPNDMAHVLNEVNPECQWVLDGEGVATRKYDGTCVMFDGRNWWARREVKPGKTPPRGWVEVDADEATGKRVGWVGFTDGPYAKVHNETQFRDVATGRVFEEGTYELCGPKINGNPQGYPEHRLIRHADAETIRLFEHLTPDFADFRQAVLILAGRNWEGIVWHHPDGRMAKLKARDFPRVDA